MGVTGGETVEIDEAAEFEVGEVPRKDLDG